MSEALTFAVVSFKRVFDTEPAAEYLTLDQLGRFLTRFMVRPKVLKALERDLQRLDAAYDAWRAGEEHSGWWARKVAQAVRKAEAGEPADLEAAVAARIEEIRTHIRKDAKKDLRIWAPALYRPGTRRESENVLHLSALVLDYDDGTSIPAARETWDPWFHIIHSTWSHTPEHHRFRLVLPLAQPVRAEDWAAVREWAEERTGYAVDPSSKSPGAQFAQPAVPHASWPREAHIHQGPLLDPVFLGLVDEAAEPLTFPTESTLLRDGDPGYRTIQHEVRAEEIDDDSLEDPDLWDPFGAGEAQHAGAPVEASPDLEARLAALEAAVVRLEVRIGGQPGLADQLERLAGLHQRGVLTDEELAAAKSRLLTD